jgi:chorismate mutase
MSATMTESTDAADSADQITALRGRIDAVDAELIRLWAERAALSREVGAVRVASGGTRVVLSREQQVVDTYRQALGPDGASLAMLLLRAGRGPL